MKKRSLHILIDIIIIRCSIPKWGVKFQRSNLLYFLSLPTNLYSESLSCQLSSSPSIWTLLNLYLFFMLIRVGHSVLTKKLTIASLFTE